MSAFPTSPNDGDQYIFGTRTWTYSAWQGAWLLNRGGPTGPTGNTGPQGVPGVLLTSLQIDTFVGDGQATDFTLSLTPISIYNMIVNVDGLVQTPNVNYSVTGDIISFVEAPISNVTIDVLHFLTGAPVTGPKGPTGPVGPGGYAGPTGYTGPTGPVVSNAGTVTISTTGTNATFYSTWVSATTGPMPLYAAAGLSYNPSNTTLSVGNNLIVQNSTSVGDISVTNTTATTSTTSGALTVNGGAGIGGNIYVGKDVVATGNMYAAGGHLHTTATTSYIVNQTPTTVYIAGDATNAVVIGNNAGTVQLNGNLQGNTNGFAIGYRDIPQISFTGNTTITGSDAGKHYYSTQNSNYTLTIANNSTVAFNIGTAITVINQGVGAINIAPADGVTLYLAGNSTPGFRTLESYGIANMQKVASNTWFLAGVGLT
jgi:hypothetical protein